MANSTWNYAVNELKLVFCPIDSHNKVTHQDDQTIFRVYDQLYDRRSLKRVSKVHADHHHGGPSDHSEEWCYKKMSENLKNVAKAHGGIVFPRRNNLVEEGSGNFARTAYFRRHKM